LSFTLVGGGAGLVAPGAGFSGRDSSSFVLPFNLGFDFGVVDTGPGAAAGVASGASGIELDLNAWLKRSRKRG
jgi:hypothetical protein